MFRGHAWIFAVVAFALFIASQVQPIVNLVIGTVPGWLKGDVSKVFQAVAGLASPVIAVSLLTYASARAGWDERGFALSRSRTPHPSHIEDLQAYARGESERVHRNLLTGYEIDLDSAMGQAFSAHRPRLAQVARALNDIDLEAFREARNKAIDSAAEAIGADWVLLADFFSVGRAAMSDFEFEVERNRVLARLRPIRDRDDPDNTWVVAYDVPSEGIDAFLERYGALAANVADLPEVRALREAMERRVPLVRELIDGLDKLEHVHQIAFSPRCELCREEAQSDVPSG